MTRSTKTPLSPWTLLALTPLLVSLASSPARAQIASLTRGEKENQATALLLSQLATTQDVSELIKKVANGLRRDLGYCPRILVSNSPITATDCMQFVLPGVVERAEKQGALDRVEARILTRLLRSVTVQGEEIVLDLSRVESPGGAGISQPAFYTYRSRKAEFAALRKAKGKPETLDPELAALLEDTYLKKMNGVGRVGPAEYLASSYSRLQLNLLGGLLEKTLNRINHSSASAVLDQPGYSSRRAEAAALETEITRLALQMARTDAATPEYEALRAEIAAKREQLSRLRGTLEADRLAREIELRQTQREQAIERLLALPSPGASGASDDSAAERERIASELERLASEIEDLKKALSRERLAIELSPTDVYRLSVSALRLELEALNSRELFGNRKPSFSDIVMAAWVSGELDSETLRAVLELDAFREYRKPLWRKTLEVSWAISHAGLMAYPATSYFAILTSIVIQSVHTLSEAERKKSDEGTLIPLPKR